MAGDIHNGYTVFSAISLAGGASVGTLATNAAPIVTSGGSVSLGGGTLSLATWGLSITTGSQMSVVPDGCLGLLHHASGFSLVYRSGSTIYTVGASAVSAARV